MRTATLLAFAGLLAPASAAQQDAGADESVWSYLSRKYDADQDGKITKEEYDRGESRFERLDRDGDGVVTEGDFESRDRRESMPSPERMREMMESTGLAVLVRYLSTDEEDGLARDELVEKFKALDADADGKLTRAEFDAEIERRKVGPYRMMGRDRFDFLVASADRDEDEQLTADEILALFDRKDGDRSGVIDGEEIPEIVRGRRGGPRGGRARDEEPEADDSPTAVGKVAPDFTLGDLEGGQTVTLSSWAGKKPVALIFGSYT